MRPGLRWVLVAAILATGCLSLGCYLFLWLATGLMSWLVSFAR